MINFKATFFITHKENSVSKKKKKKKKRIKAPIQERIQG